MTSVGLLKIADITLGRSTYDACIRRDMKGTRKGYTSIIEGVRKGCLRLVYQMVEEDNHM